MAEGSLAVAAPQGDLLEPQEFRFADFVFYTNGPLLMKGDEELSVEPQVLELLHFLIKNSNRYILTEELHTEVWKGRVVSDAAVRRAISKLRACLGQNCNDEPYIKSATKRGYKFNADLQIGNKSKKPIIENKIIKVPVLVSAVVLLVILTLIGMNLSFDKFTPNTPENNKQNSKFLSAPIISFQGEKTDLTKSDDGQWLAFAGKNVGFQGFQLFLSNLNNRVTKQLTINEDNVIRVEFSRNNNRLYYINLAIGNSSLSAITFDETHQIIEKTPLVRGYYFLADFTLTPDEKGLYFTGVKNKSASSQVFYLDLSDFSINEITSGYQNESHDYRISMSQNGAYLAVVSVMGQSEQKISLIDSSLHKVKQRYFYESPLLSVEWLNEKELLLLDNTSLVKLNIETGRRIITKKTEETLINSIDITPAGEIVALTEGNKANFFVEIDFPSMQLTNKKILTGIADNIDQVMFSGQKYGYLLLNKEGSTYKLVQQRSSGSEKITIFSSTLPINVQSISADGERILLFLDGLLAIFHRQEQKLEYIHSGDRMLAAEAIFSQSGQEVIFGERTNDGWTIKSANLVTGQQSMLFEGFYSALEYKGGYLLRDENGKVYLHTESENEPKFLNVEVMVDKRSTWLVRGDILYWSIHDGITAQFFAKNLLSGDHYSLNFDSSLVSSNFELNQKGDKAILQSQQLPDSQIVAINIDQ